MNEDEKAIENLVLIRLLKLNASITGIILGLVIGFTIFLSTNILLIRGGEVVGPHLALLGQFFPGYTVTFLGSLVGLLYGILLGFLVGYIFARLYNWLAGLRESRRIGIQ
jgi:hypothetical protein